MTHDEISEVCSFAIFNPAGQILLGPRAATLRRHPRVVSTPVVRITPDEASRLVDRDMWEWTDLRADTVITALLRRVSPRLSSTTPSSGLAATHWTTSKWIPDVGGTGVDELTRMTTVRVNLGAPWDLTPDPYFFAGLGWYDPALFLKAWDARDPSVLDLDAAPWQPELHGACVESAAHILREAK